MKYLLLTGRILFSAIFLLSAPGHFSEPSISFAVTKGLPLANVLVPLSGIVEFLGALSIITGYKSRYGALLLVLFMVPVTLVMHNFWTLTDPMQKQMDMAMFMKNVSITGAALIIAYLGTGPLSLGEKDGAVKDY